VKKSLRGDYGKDKHFASGKLTKVVEKPLRKLTEVDKAGHEKFENDDEMYKTYTTDYGCAVNKETIAKLVWFELVN